MDVTVLYVILVAEILVGEIVLVHRVRLVVILMGAIYCAIVIVMVYVDKVVPLGHPDAALLLVRPQAERKHKNSFKTR